MATIDTPDATIDALVAGLAPVARRGRGRDIALLLGLGAVEIALYLALHGMRPDLGVAMAGAAFWWKTASLAALVAISGVTAFASFDPVVSPRRGLRRFAAVAAVAIIAGWGIDAASGGTAALAARLDPRDGLACVLTVVVLSLAPLIVLGRLMDRGAPTDPRGTAAAVGLTAAAWGGFVFVLACPHDDPLYVVVWYTAGMAAVAVMARLVLPRLTRW